MTAENAMKFELLFDIAKKTKTALLNERRTQGFFTDKNYLDCQRLNHPGGGLITEGIGLTGLLLLLVAFKDEKNVLTEEDKQELQEIILESLNKVCDFSKNGFNVTPYINAQKMKGLFDEEYGYTDAITWSVSSAILAVYAERSGALKIDEQTKDAVMEMMAAGLKQILGGQRSDGTWGFRADPKAERSLYFTYSVSATIADFFDYITDELGKDVDTTSGKKVVMGTDDATINYLNQKLGYDVVESMKSCRKALQEYLLKDCLPLLPALAECNVMSESQRAHLGMWEHDGRAYEEGGAVKAYLNLYYAYYLIDMMTTAGADLRYAEIIKSESELAALVDYYRTNALMNQENLKYYFEEGHQADLISSLIEPAIFATRSQYGKAAETGLQFWDSVQSELSVYWRHGESGLQTTATYLREGVRNPPTICDPSLKPMALRANINYRFYVSEETDVAIDRLFADICKDVCVSVEDEEDEDALVVNLWDNMSYSLPVTERAIEAIVDYYDYINKFYVEKEQEKPENEQTPEVVVETVIKVEKSPFELAMEQKMAEYFDAKMDEYFNRKISEYFNSAEGKRLIASAVAEAVSAQVNVPPKASGMLVHQQVIDYITELCSDLSGYSSLAADGCDEEKAALALINLLNFLSKMMIQQEMLAGGRIREIEVEDKANKYTNLVKKVRQRAYEDLEKPNKNLLNLYDAVKRIE